MSHIFSRFTTFHREHGVLGVTILATIFTFGFVRIIQSTVINPVMRAYVLPDRSGLDVSLRNNEVVRFSELVPELISYFVIMLVLFFVWLYTTSRRQAT